MATVTRNIKDYPLITTPEISGNEIFYLFDPGTGSASNTMLMSTLQDYLLVPTGTVTNAANVGTSGQQLFLQKSGSILQFKNLGAGSSKTSITFDIVNNLINFDVVESNLTLSSLGGSLLPTQILGEVPLSKGGTAASTAPMALSNLGAMPVAGGAFTGPINGVTPIELGFMSGVTSNVQIQLNAISTGISQKEGARIAVTTNVVILTPGATLDGITMVINDRVLLTGQTLPEKNGVYVWNGAATPMTRSTDCSTGGTGVTGIEGMSIQIETGTSANTSWYLATDPPITIDTTPLMYIITSRNTYTGSDGITLTGNNFTLNNSYFSGAFTVAAGGAATISNNYVTNAMLAGSISFTKLVGTDITSVGTLSIGAWHASIIGAPYGGTGIDSSSSTGSAELNLGTWSFTPFTGSGNVVKSTSPVFTTPDIGAAVAFSVNGLTIGTTTGILNIANLSKFQTSGAFESLHTFTDTTSITYPTSGTLSTLAGTESLTNKTINGVTIVSSAATLSLANLSSFATVGAFSVTNTYTGITTVTFPTTGTLATLSGTETLSNKTFVAPVLGVATITSINGLTVTTTTGTLSLANGSTLSTSGAFSLTATVTATTNVTFPTTGTLATLAGVETLSNKTLVSPILGTPLSGNASNLTNLPISGIAGLGSGVATWLATPSSANLASAITDETGSGALVFATSPALTTPNVGAATATSISNANGTVGAPSYTFTSGTTNGFYVSGTNKIGVSSAGVQVAEFNPTGLFTQNNIVVKKTATTVSGSATATGSQLFGGIISMTGGGGVTLTFDTAANIYAAMGSPAFVGAAFSCFIVSTGGTNTTIATNTGLTLVLGATTVNNDGRNYHFVVTNTSTPTITVYGG